MANAQGVSRIRRSLKSLAYSGWSQDRRTRWQHPDRIIEVLALGEGARVADLGAGGGYFTFRLAEAVGPSGRVYAVDTDADMRSLITERADQEGRSNAVSVAAPADDPALPEAVDVILIVSAFHHLPDPAAYFTALARYLRPGGRVAVIEQGPKWYLFGHATEPAQIQSIMAAAGYAVVGRHDFLPRQSFLVFEPEPAPST